VVPIFQEQIAKGGPITVTDPEMKRYFMTIPEATQLVIQAACLGQGGEIFILNMGEPVRIVDLAKDLIALSGLRPNEDIEIVYTGVRPGEKLFEELSTEEEHADSTRHPKIFVGRVTPRGWSDVTSALDELKITAESGDSDGVRLALKRMVPECVFDGPRARPRESKAPVTKGREMAKIPQEA
jgi:FlaA1/EpsC-like NDP-sugar epimerase